MGKVSINTSSSNIFQNLLLPAIFRQNCQDAFGRCEYFLARNGLISASVVL